MNKIKFIVFSKPIGKGRARYSRINGYIRAYTPKSTVDYENLVKSSALEQCKGQLDKEYTGPVKMSIKAYFKPNKSTSKKQYNLLMGQAHLKRPDLDNLIKIICDGLNGIAYKDDNQVAIIRAEKVYSDLERTEVDIEYVQ